MKTSVEDRLEDLHEQGFDYSEIDEDDPERISVRCSQCNALVINGLPSHEFGCPNRKRSYE